MANTNLHKNHTEQTQQASAERASPPADEDGQAEVPVATVARSQTVIAKTSREASERRIGGTTRDDGANQSGVNDKAKGGRAGDGMDSPKLQEFNELWASFQKIDTPDIMGEGRPSEFAEETLAHHWQLAANGSQVYVIDRGLLFKGVDESVHSLHEKALMFQVSTGTAFFNWFTIILGVRMAELKPPRNI